MAATYREIEKDILPQLRRTLIKIDYDITGYSDEELVTLGKNNPSELDIEELLKAGSLMTDMNDKLTLYKAGADRFPNDYRAANNAAAILIMQGENDMAASYMAKATAAEENNITNNNMGILARRSGDRTAAMNYYGKAGSASEVSYNKGLIQIQNGEYDAAIGSTNGKATFNTALVKMLNGDLSGASSDMADSGDDSAMADYLRAIIAARSGDSTAVLSNITSATGKDASLKGKAKKDLEFRDFHSQFSF
jgi:tetratricopeptide (TPR) repeat protein